VITKHRQKPFLKWAGNKFRIIDHISEKLPEGKRLIEPFCGSAALFLNSSYKNYIIADSNHDLINLYRILQKEGNEFIGFCKQFFTKENNSAEVYYHYRDEFNQTSDERLKAALFIYLNKHGYNGLCRYNQSGGFNVPFGRYIKPYLPKDEMLFFFEKSKKVKFLNQPFQETMKMATKGDVIYCDPPYVPLSATNSSFQYEKNGFNQHAQMELATLAEKLSHKGIPVLVSNHYTEFTKEIYKEANLKTFYVRRNISCKIANREKAQEVLALFNRDNIKK